MPSGVVFVAILVIWAVILAPRAMKVYERTATQRTTKRFSSAMTVLGNGKTVGRVAVDTARRGSRVPVDTHSTALASPARSYSSDLSGGLSHGRSHRAASSRAVMRRRRVVAVLAAFLGLATAAGLLGVIHWTTVMVAGVPLVLFLGACAASVRPRREEGETRARVAINDQPQLAPAQPLPSAGTAGRETGGVVSLSTRRARRRGLRAGSWTQARVLEADLAIAATYDSPEEQLGLDRYVASPSDVDGHPYLRAANE